MSYAVTNISQHGPKREMRRGEVKKSFNARTEITTHKLTQTGGIIQQTENHSQWRAEPIFRCERWNRKYKGTKGKGILQQRQN